MAFLQITFFSRVLGMNTSVNVILPEFTPEEHSQTKIKQPYFQTLYLLHGYLGDCSDWLRFSSIERYAYKHRLAVIMPSAANSFYSNTTYGQNYWDYIAKELPAIMGSYFPLSQKREDNFVAGLSMGGYGAFKLALHSPERYAAAISFSGVVDIAGFMKRCEENPQIMDGCETPNFKAIFGESTDISYGENDLIHLIKNSEGELPKLRMYCGNDDFLLNDNIYFHSILQNKGIDCELNLGPGGHEWNFWDKSLEQALEWAPLKRTLLFEE